MSKLSYIRCEQLDEASADCTNKSYVAIKKCRMLRSGVQLYAHDEVPEELLKLLPAEKQNQQIYKVYRKPEAIVKHLSDFNYIAFVNTHPSEDVTPDNYKELSIGQVGGTAKLETLDDGNVYVDNEVVFTDKEAYQEYLDGKKEVSIGLNAMWRLADSNEYDFEVYDFENVNHLALVPRARAGKMAKIMDSNTVVDRLLNTCGGTKMKGFLKIFGIKKTNDEALLSDKVFAGINQITKEMKDEDVGKVVNPIIDCISSLGETEQKKVLLGIVTDALSDVEAVKGADEESKKKLTDSIDKLYAKCKELDEEAAHNIIADACGETKADKPAEDAKPEDKKDDKEADKPAEDAKPEDKPEDKKADKPAEDACGKTKDSASEVESLVVSAVAKALDSGLDAKIEAAVKKALHLDDKKPEAKGAVTDASVDFDCGDILPNGWNR